MFQFDISKSIVKLSHWSVCDMRTLKSLAIFVLIAESTAFWTSLSFEVRILWKQLHSHLPVERVLETFRGCLLDSSKVLTTFPSFFDKIPRKLTYPGSWVIASGISSCKHSESSVNGHADSVYIKTKNIVKTSYPPPPSFRWMWQISNKHTWMYWDRFPLLFFLPFRRLGGGPPLPDCRLRKTVLRPRNFFGVRDFLDFLETDFIFRKLVFLWWRAIHLYIV